MRLLVFILLCVLLVLQYRLWVGEGSFAEVHNLREQGIGQEKELEGLRERNRALQAEVHDLKHGQEAMEELARSELGMIREGETFYHMVEPSRLPPPAPPAKPADKKR